jgi:hypothetical protein
VRPPRRPRRPQHDGRTWDQLTEDERVGVLDWIVDVCLFMGAGLGTCYLVAAEFARGMEPELYRRWPR